MRKQPMQGSASTVDRRVRKKDENGLCESLKIKFLFLISMWAVILRIFFVVNTLCLYL